MESPFPGMDPYLEAQGLWRSFHTRVLTYVSNDLQRQVAPHYAVLPEERVVIGVLDQERWPDVQIRSLTPPPRGSAATVTAPPADEEVLPRSVDVPELTQRHRYLVIRDVQSRAIVTIIEILSPWHKTGRGREEYRQKQEEILLSETHLVEIDLLRGGSHTVAVPASRVEASDYRVSIHPARASRFDVFCFGVRDRLPTLRVPLRDDAPGPLLHLQATLSACYSEGPYAFLIDYSAPPEPPLAPDDAAWAAERIAAWRRSQGPEGAPA